jgi:tetratricopeptide (TPR) repeat protein
MDAKPSLDDIVQMAKSAYEAEEYDQAATLYHRAADEFRNNGDMLGAAEMDNNRSVAMLQAGNAEGALSAAQGTDLTFAEAGDTHRQAMALGNQAAAYEEMKQYDQAMALYQQSSELLKVTGDKELRSYVLKRISNLQFHGGERYEAIATMQTALDSREKLGVQERFLKGLLNKVSQLLGQK